MADEFKPIETQEQLNAIIGERLSRLEKKNSEETAGLRKEIETLTKAKDENAAKLAESEKKLKESESKVKEYETAAVKARIAKEAGIPEGFVDRLRGTTEEELKKDAEELKKLFPEGHAPKKSTAASGNGEKDPEAGVRKLVQSLTDKN